MANIKLDELLSQYLEIQKKEEEFKSKKDELKESILKEMGTETKYQNNEGSIAITKADTYKYKDEQKIINVLIDNGYSSFIKAKVDTTSFNKFLKENEKSPLVESLGDSITKTTIDKLTVKAING